MNSRKLINFAVTLLFLLTLAGWAAAQAKQPVPVPTSPKPLKYKDLRSVIYCEVWLFKGTPETGIAGVYYNTSDFNNQANKKDTCPADMWAKITVPDLEKQYDVIAAYKNGPRGWTMDWIDLPVGPVVDFNGLKTRWMGQGELPKGVTLAAAHMGPTSPCNRTANPPCTLTRGSRFS